MILSRKSDMKKTVQQGHVWKPVEFRPGEGRRWAIENIDIYIKKEGTSWFVCTEKQAERYETWKIAETCKKPRDCSWVRYIGDSENTIQLIPVVPDKPLILFPDVAAKLLPEKSARFAVEIPLWIRIRSISGKNDILLCEIPVREFSWRWFGDPLEGELCYSLTVPFVEEPGPREENELNAVCFITIHNNSLLQLDLQKFLLHAEYLFLFEADSRLWTDEVAYHFRGPEQSSQIGFSKRAPKEAARANLISRPRIPTARSIIKRSFDMLKSVTGS